MLFILKVDFKYNNNYFIILKTEPKYKLNYLKTGT